MSKVTYYDLDGQEREKLREAEAKQAQQSMARMEKKLQKLQRDLFLQNERMERLFAETEQQLGQVINNLETLMSTLGIKQP